MRRAKIIIAALTALWLLSACSSKKYFEPEKSLSASFATHALNGKIVDLTRSGATLHDGRYIGKAGESRFALGEGYRYLNENESYVLAGNEEGVLKIIDKSSGEPVRAVAFHIPIIAASIENGLVAYILQDNTFGVYEIEGNRKLLESKSERTLAIDTRAAAPIFVGALVVVPTLDGKLIIVDPHNSENAKAVYISSEENFNNVIYLKRFGNFLVAATPKKLVVLGAGGKREYGANISEVAVGNDALYLFTKEGEIIKLNGALQPMARKKFRFAHYSAAAAFGGKVFALDQKGSLIVLSADLDRYKIYDVGDVNNPPLIIGKLLYKDGKVIELAKLGYQ